MYLRKALGMRLVNDTRSPRAGSCHYHLINYILKKANDGIPSGPWSSASWRHLGQPLGLGTF